MSLRTLQRIMHALGLKRHRRNAVNIHDITAAITTELSGSGKDLGYRAMHSRILKKYHIVTNRESVRQLLLQLDPVGVNLRKRRRLKRRQYFVRGPNYLWHIDGWDKLKRFGLCIHGCIDGYSRHIVWLQVSATNNEPNVIGRYFTEAVRQLEGIPRLIRADRGTENVNVEKIKSVLRSLNNDNPATAFLYGKSTSNQRIESWWSKFKAAGMNSWINEFKLMEENGVIDTSNEIDMQCIRFCFMPLLQAELNSIVKQWNTHHITTSASCITPSGKPDVMYYLPGMYNTIDYTKPFNDVDLNIMEEVMTKDPPSGLDVRFLELFDIIME